jgi:TRAP-type C4-dicarboxylate transport system permease small subunit
LYRIKKIFGFIEKIIEYICMIGLLAMTVIVFGTVFSRYVFGFTPGWSGELTILILAWSSLIGMALGVKTGIHITITFIVDSFPKYIRKFFLIFDQVLVMIFGIILIVYGWILCGYTVNSTMPGIGLPSDAQYLMLPFVGVLIIIYTCMHTVNIVLNKKSD